MSNVQNDIQEMKPIGWEAWSNSKRDNRLEKLMGISMNVDEDFTEDMYYFIWDGIRVVDPIMANSILNKEYGEIILSSIKPHHIFPWGKKKLQEFEGV